MSLIERAEKEIRTFERVSMKTANEMIDRIKHLEEEVSRLRYYSPYPEDNPEVETVHEPDSNTALFRSYGG